MAISKINRQKRQNFGHNKVKKYRDNARLQAAAVGLQI
jgi:hypothetical protein